MIWLIVCLLVAPFAIVLLVGAPYLPTRKIQAREALDMLGLQRGDIFVDLGSGDGSVLIEAAARGCLCYGYELNPLMWLVSKLRLLRYGKQVKIYCRNFWNVPLPPNTQGVFVFLLDKYMPKLNEKLLAELNKGAALVSYTFQIPDKKSASVKNALFLYKY